jgi:hypothetical protein
MATAPVGIEIAQRTPPGRHSSLHGRQARQPGVEAEKEAAFKRRQLFRTS